jgi:hypothetical protein
MAWAKAEIRAKVKVEMRASRKLKARESEVMLKKR